MFSREGAAPLFPMRSGVVFSPHLNLSREVAASVIVNVPGAKRYFPNTCLCGTGFVLLYSITDSPILNRWDSLGALTQPSRLS